MKNEVERRSRLALDESYRYYKLLETKDVPVDIYKLVKCLNNVQSAVNNPKGEFHLTRQLWQQVYYAMFDKLITNFAGYCLVKDERGRQISPKKPFPDDGMLEFHPQGLRRQEEDMFNIEIKHLYPATQRALAKAWESKGAVVNPKDFGEPVCGPEGCFLKPVLLGDEILGAESCRGKDTAHRAWWELYWQAYCTMDDQEQTEIFNRMHEIETVWGSMYY